MKRRGYMERGGYPVDANGFPVPVWETAVPFLEDEKQTNHHYNFYARSFGSFAIAQTFRDLASQQILMPDRSHTVLHQLYGGVRLPPVAAMLEHIEEEKFYNGKLNIREPYNGYVRHEITDELMEKLYREYNNF